MIGQRKQDVIVDMAKPFFGQFQKLPGGFQIDGIDSVYDLNQGEFLPPVCQRIKLSLGNSLEKLPGSFAKTDSVAKKMTSRRLSIS